MNFRKISIVAGILIVVAGFIIQGQLAASKKEPKRNQLGNLKRQVLVQEVNNGSINVQIPITGKLTAKTRIEVYAEVSGKLLPTNKEFKVGVTFNKGDVLLAIDKAEFEMNLLASKSNFLSQMLQVLPDLKIDYPNAFNTWKTFADNINIKNPLPTLPIENDKKVTSFLASRNILNAYYNLQSQETRLEKYTIIAPFNGVVAQSTINTGTLIRANQKVGEFIEIGNYEIEAAINVQDLNFINIGDSVLLQSPDLTGFWYGSVARISKNINPNTQTFSVFVNVKNTQLHEGMFLTGNIKGNKINQVFSIDRRLLVGNEVYAVNDTVLTKIPVTIKKYDKENVIVSGLPNNTLILKEPVAGSYNGMPVIAAK